MVDSLQDLQQSAINADAGVPMVGQGTGPTSSDKQMDFQSRLASARAAGYSWDDIGQHLAQQRQTARDAGYSDTEINAHYGLTGDTDLSQRMLNRARGALALSPPNFTSDSMMENFKEGLKSSSSGLPFFGLPEKTVSPDASFMTRIAFKAGVGLGDLPFMVAGALGAGAAASETGPGALVAGAAGAFALPAFVKGEYAYGLSTGQISGPREFAEAQMGVLWNTAKEALLGAATGASGAGVGALAAKFGLGAATTFAAKTSAELATMTAGGAALQGHLPTPQDLLDSAVLMPLLMGTTHLAVAAPRVIGTIRDNLSSNWVRTGQSPADASRMSYSNPILRQELSLPQPVEPPPGSSETRTAEGSYVIPRSLPPAVTAEADMAANGAQIDHVAQQPGWGDFLNLKQTVGPGGVGGFGGAPPSSVEIAPYLQEFGKRAGFSFMVGPAQRMFPGTTVPYSEAAPQGVQGPAHIGFSRPGEGYAGGIVYMPATADEALHSWIGLNRAQILYHEVGHAINASGSKTGQTLSFLPTGALRDEMMMASKQFRPKQWQMDPAYVQRPEELMADSIASWLIDPTLRQRMPEFTAKYGAMLEPYRKIAERYLPTLTKKPETGTTGNMDDPAAWQAPAEGRGVGAAGGGAGGGGGEPPEGPPAVGGPAEGPAALPRPVPSLDEALASVAGRIAEPFRRPGLWQRLQTAGGALYREFFDQTHPLTQLTQAGERGGLLEGTDNPKFLRRLAENTGVTSQYAAQEAMIDLNRNVIGRSLVERLKPVLQESGNDTFWTYALARRALAFSQGVEGRYRAAGRGVGETGPEIDQQGNVARSEGPRGPERETGVDLEHAQIVRDAGEERYGPVFNDLIDYRNQTLAWERDAGMLTPEQYDHLVRTVGDALPGYRVEPEGSPGHATNNRGGGQLGYSTVKAADGSTLLYQHPLVSILQDTFRRRQMAENNVANRAAVDLAEPLGLATKVRSSAWDTSSPADEAAIGRMMGGLDGGPDGAAIHVVEQRTGWTFKSDEVPIFRDGQVEVWKFADPELTRYLKGMDQPARTVYQSILATFGRFQRASIVSNPLFPIRNLIYDLPFQFIIKPGARNVIADMVTGMRGMWEHSRADGTTPEGVTNPGLGDHYDAWLRSGGAERVFEALGKDDYIKDVFRGQTDPAYTDGIWNGIKTVPRAMQAWSQFFSQSMRSGRYIRGVEAGENPDLAAVASTEAGLHRPGAGGTVSRAVNQVAPFSLAYFKGLEQTMRGLVGIGETTAGAKYDWASTWAKGVAALTVPAMALWYENKDKAWYKAQPEWVKDNALSFHVGPDEPGQGYTFHIPLPPILGMVFAGMPRRLAEAFLNDNPHAAKGLAGSLGMSFAPPFASFSASMFTPIFEKVANYSFFRGRPLTPNWMKDSGMLPQEQYTPYSTDTAKSLSRFVNDLPIIKGANLSPIEIDNFIKQWGGTMGDAAVHVAESAARAAGVISDNRPASGIEDWPGLSSWMSRSTSATNQPTLDFEDRMHSLKAVHGSMEAALKAGDLARFKELTSSYPAAAVLQRLSAKQPLGADKQEYADAARGAMESQRGNMQTLQQVYETDKSLTKLREFTRFVGALKLSEPLTSEQSRFVDQAAQFMRKTNTPGVTPEVASLDAAKTGTISANDKRQLLDWSYATMQTIAEHGNKAMNQVKLP